MDYNLDFLTLLDKVRLRTLYCKIILLDFKYERPLKEILGLITAGSITVNGSSAVRRTVNLTMLASPETSNVENLKNDIAINKKVKILVGYENPLRELCSDEIVWFPQGIFVLSNATVARSTSGWNITINGKDKMCLLDGTAGGTFPDAITFHEKLIEHKNGDVDILEISMFDIIFEAVNHWGKEEANKIIISDIPEKVKLLVKNMSSNTLYFNNNYSGFSFDEREDFEHAILLYQDAGYQETIFVYPGELIMKAGDNVVSLLNKIKQALGNFEFYYDIDGNFVFLLIKNYLNTGSPLKKLDAKDYVKSYDNAKYLYSLTDLDETTAINRNPKFDNIKNDFIVWGERTISKDYKLPIHYHLAIDEKPLKYLADKWVYRVYDTSNPDITIKYEFSDEPPTKDNKKVFYETTEGVKLEGELIAFPSNDKEYGYRRDKDNKLIYDTTSALKTIFPYDWREELYRRILRETSITGVYEDGYYDAEMLAHWRLVYDSMLWPGGWLPALTLEYPDYSELTFWIDFIDSNSELGKYSVREIGRRTKVVNDTKIKTIYNSKVPDVIFINSEEKDDETIAEYETMGLKYFILLPLWYNMFATSSTGTSCYEKVRELMYLNLSYNTTILITCLPKYYMEPNNIIGIDDKESDIHGNFQITLFTLPLTYNGTMSITATEVLTRI